MDAGDSIADRTLAQTKATIVCIDRHVTGLPFDRVSSDNVTVGSLSVEHLLSLAIASSHLCTPSSA